MTGWIGVDLDGTLAHYEGWNNGAIGEPIKAMADRVKDWLLSGIEVKIFTARVARTGMKNDVGGVDDDNFVDKQILLIQNWSEKHLGKRLAVTATKDFKMIELWDDRAVQVIPNTGKRADNRE